jgi:type VI secretion system secreted protein Hcp
MIRSVLAAALAAPLLLVASPSGAAMNAYVSLRANGTELQCESSNPAFEHHAEVFAVATNLILPLSSGGQATGARQHSPIRLTKALDRCTPLLAQALVQNQDVEAVIKFVRQDENGQVVHYFTIRTRQGRIAGQSLVLPDTADPSTSNLPALEHLSLTFRSITWTHVIDGIEVEDVVSPQ